MTVLEIGVPKRLFDLHYPADDVAFDVTPDGKRFLVETPVQALSQQALTVVTNWTASLKK